MGSTGSDRTEAGKLLLVVCAVGAFVLWMVDFNLCSREPGGFYGWQTEAFLSGHLHLRMEPSPRLAELTNPYLGDQNGPYRILDASYYRGHYYSYFGVGPIVLLTLPWRLVTHTYLTEPGATALLVLLANAVGLLVLLKLRRMAYRDLTSGEMAAALLLVSLGSFSTVHLAAVNSGTVAQAGAYLCFTAVLLCLVKAIGGNAAVPSLACASLFCGLAVACRPSFAPIALLLAPPSVALCRKWGGPEPFSRVALAAVLPAALVAAALMAYNRARFDSVWEFGNRYQLTNVDYRGAQLLSSSPIWTRLVSFATAPLATSHYFPFVANTHDTRAVGLLWMCPASLLTLGCVSLIPGPRASMPKGLPAVALGALLAFLGVMAFLAAYQTFLFHYEVDFVVPWVWVAALGWFSALTDERFSPSLRRLLSRVGILLCGASVVIAVLFSLSLIDIPSRARLLARVFNGAVDRIDRISGISYGGIRLRATFAPQQAGARLPLLATGREHNDLVYAEVLPHASVRFGLFHAGIGGPVSDPLALDLAKPHEIEIYEGSLLPPAEHPFFSLWPPGSIARARRSLEVTVDGIVVLSGSAEFYPPSPADLVVGRNPALHDIARDRFPGDIALVRVLPWGPDTLSNGSLVGTGAVALELRFPPGHQGSIEPLFSTGEPGRGDLVYVKYLPLSKIRLGVDHWGQGAVDSEDLVVDTSLPHRVVIVSRALATGGTASDRFAVSFDGTPVLKTQLEAYACDADDVYVGFNAVRSSVSGPMFGGTILNSRAVSPPAPAPADFKFGTAHPGDLTLSVTFGSWASAAGEPLLVVGHPGSADIVYVVRPDAGHARFGFDHWGLGGAVGAPVPLDIHGEHTIRISLGSLRDTGARQSLPADGYEVALDGQTVLAGNSPFYPSEADSIFVGENPVGGSTTRSTFNGRILLQKAQP